jgi:uncharacterized protein YbjQ (UPF0145 family)
MKCEICNKQVSWSKVKNGLCEECYAQKNGKSDEINSENLKILNAIMITTESNPNLKISDRLGIVSAEYVIGLNIFKDFFSSIRDVVGGRNNSFQKALKEAKETLLLELRKEAYSLNANAVIAIDLDYSEISGGGKSMLFVVASGTAVKISNEKEE